jgi:hypothetical protein
LSAEAARRADPEVYLATLGANEKRPGVAAGPSLPSP